MAPDLRQFLLCVSLLAAAPALPQSVPRPMEIADAVGARSIAGFHSIASFSPDGALVAYTVCDPRAVGEAVGVGFAQLTAGCAVRVSAADGGEPMIVNHEGDAWAPAWSPDGKSLAFYGDDADGMHLWLWDRQSHATRRIAAANLHVSGRTNMPLWMADGNRIISKLPGTPTAAGQMSSSPALRVPAWAALGSDGATVEIAQSGVTAAAVSELAPPHYPPVDMALFDVTTGEVTRIASDVRVANYWLSPDSRRLAFMRYVAWPMKEEKSYRWSLDVADLREGGVQTLATLDQFHAESVRWAPDSRSLVYFSGASQGSAAAFVVTIGTAPRQLVGAGGFSTMAQHVLLWDNDGDSVYAIDAHTLWRGDVQAGRIAAVGTWPGWDLLRIVPTIGDNEAWSGDGGASVNVVALNRAASRVELLRIGIDKSTMRALGDATASIGGKYEYPVVAPDGRSLAYAAQNAQRPADLWIASTDFTRRRRLTSLNPELDGTSLGAARLIEFTSRSGRPLRAALLLPAGYVPGRRYPLVTWIYGGSMGSDFVHRFGLTQMSVFNMQMLSTRGYAVLFPDIPLNPGGVYVDSLMDAVMPAIDATIAAGIAAPDRLAIMGHSAGGYGTLALVTRTPRFQAAVMCAGFGELASFYGHGWFGLLEGNNWMGAAPWQAPQRYMENSPIYYLDRISTPLLIEAGEQDEAVGRYPHQVFTSLQRLNANATLVKYRGEGHVLRSHPNLVDFWNRVTAFLDHHLKGT